MNKNLLIIGIVFIMLASIVISQEASDSSIDLCGYSWNTSATSFIVRGMNVTYTTCLPDGQDGLMIICDGYVTSRDSSNEHINLRVRRVIPDFNNFLSCEVYDIGQEKTITVQNITVGVE